MVNKSININLTLVLFSITVHQTMSAAKKSKTYHFNNDWEEEFFFTMNKDKCMCLICNTTVALPKRGNLNRHFNALHAHYNYDFPQNSLIRKDQVKKLKTSLYSQQSFFKKVCNKSTSATVASLRVSRILVKHKKPFTDGEIFKQAFLEASDSLFENVKNKPEIIEAIQGMQLSRKTVTRRVEMMAMDVRLQLKSDFETCVWFSLQFDESTDACDMAQLSIFTRLVFIDCTVKEELLKIVPLKERTRGEDVYNAFRSIVTSENLPIKKLVSITTDGAPAMVGRENGFIAFCKKDKEFPNFIAYHCIIHQQALCGKMLNLDEVMTQTIKIINSIRAKALQRRLFKSLLDEVDAHYGDLLLHNEVRWLSKGSILARFRELLPHIKVFLLERNDNNAIYLQNNKWLERLAFLTDVTMKLNEVNLELQGKNLAISDMITSINSFKMKLKLWISQLHKKDLKHFSNLKDEISSNIEMRDYEEFANVLEQILAQFEKRFSEFDRLSPIITFLASPFEKKNITNVAEKIGELFEMDLGNLELQIIELQSDIVLKARPMSDVWIHSPCKYALLKDIYLRVHSCFGSTYLCESSFSHMNFIKSKYRTRLTDNHLDDSLCLAITNYEPNYKKIAGDLQCQISH